MRARARVCVWRGGGGEGEPREKRLRTGRFLRTARCLTFGPTGTAASAPEPASGSCVAPGAAFLPLFLANSIFTCRSPSRTLLSARMQSSASFRATNSCRARAAAEMAVARVAAAMEVVTAAGVTVVAMAAEVRVVAREVEAGLRVSNSCRAVVRLLEPEVMGACRLLEPEVVGRSGRWHAEVAAAAAAAAAARVRRRRGRGGEGRRGLAMRGWRGRGAMQMEREGAPQTRTQQGSSPPRR